MEETWKELAMKKLLNDVLLHLHAVQTGYKGSIGSIDNAYCPQLDVKQIDELEARVAFALSDHGLDVWEAHRIVNGTFPKEGPLLGSKDPPVIAETGTVKGYPYSKEFTNGCDEA